MTFLFNDLSLGGQYAQAEDFHRELDELLAVLARVPGLRGRLFSSRSLGNRPVTATQNFQQAVRASNDRDFVRRVLGWIASAGPFWEDERTDNADDCFYFDGSDVTDQGLGETARRHLAGVRVASFGMLASPHRCDAAALDVLHGLLEAPIGTVNVPNLAGTATLLAQAERDRGPPTSWIDMLERIGTDYPTLALGSDLIRTLRPHPFSVYVAERTCELLGILHAYVVSRDANGLHTARTNEIVDRFFAGSRARFTDESRSNKDEFAQEMTFEDPLDAGRRVFCPFHGKINTPPFRIHFAWPLPASEKHIRIVYIGPKITR